MLTAGKVCLLLIAIVLASTGVNAKSTKGRELFKKASEKVEIPQPSGWVSRCFNGHTLTITACDKQDGDESKEGEEEANEDGDLFSQEMIKQSFEEESSVKLTEATSVDNQRPKPDGWVSRCFNGYTVTVTACEGGESEEGDGEIDGDLFSGEVASWNEEEQRKNIKHKKVPTMKIDGV